MKKLYTALLFTLTIISASYSQHTFTGNNSSLEIGGYVIAFYQWRSPKASGDKSKNTFMLDDARLELKGMVKGGIKYSVEVNFVDIITIANSIYDIKHAPITEAHIQYINPILNVKAGYFKVPFGASSLMDKVPSPFLQRTLIADGNFFARRDAGIMIYKDLWHQRVNLTFAVISGVGEAILLGAADPNGKFEYVAHASIANAYYRDEEIDYKNLATPIFRVGVGARYNEKSTFTGNATGSVDYAPDNIKTINGTKISYEVDAGFMWRGFSAQFELGHSYNRAADGTPLAKLLAPYGTNHFYDGGYLVQANYYHKKILSTFAVRYSDFKITDLVANNAQRTMSFAYNFYLPHTSLTLKAHFDYRLNTPGTSTQWDQHQLRIGAQYLF